MKTLVVVNLTEGGGAAMKTVAGNRVLDRVIDYALRLVPREDILVLGNGTPAATDLASSNKTVWTDADLVLALKEAAGRYDDIVYVYGDAPFLDSELTKKMLANHRTYFAEYTFADGYPYGLAPEIMKTRIVAPLEKLLKTPPSPLKRDTLFTLIQRDINAFDLETELSPEDQRLLRVSLTTDTKRNHLLCERIAAEKAEGTAAITELLGRKPEILRTLPAYIQVQIAEGCPQSCSMCPYPGFGGDPRGKNGEMPVELFGRIAEETAELCGDAVIGVSLRGEPSIHGRFEKIAEAVAKREGLKLLVETSGLGWKDETLKAVKDLLGNRVTWILSLDATDEAAYSALRGEGFREAMDRAKDLLALFPETTYVQAVRMKENEDALETFYRTWKEKTQNVIIQKYDWFSGFLEQKKVTDLSPLNRFPCWHLKRELTILIDGTVTLCREDISKRHVLGKIGEAPLSEIWKRGNELYLDHLKKTYPDICGSCDEYYTYNF